MASSAVISAVKLLGGLAVDEANNLYGVSKKIERLQRDLKWMFCFLEDAEKKLKRDRLVAMWVDEIREFADEAEDICECYFHKVSNPQQNGGWRTKIRWGMCVLYDAPALHEVGSRIDDLRDRIAELMARLQLYGVQVTHREEEISSRCNLDKVDMMRAVYSPIEEPIGLEKHTKQVVQQLVKCGQVKVVGICGIRGLGKTTLARNVYQDATIKEHFKQRAWVYISRKFDRDVVFRQIIVGLTNANYEKRNEISCFFGNQLAQKISEILKQSESLVVLDDLWTKQDWDILNPAFGLIESTGGKLLITTPNSGLMNHFHHFGYSYNPGFFNQDDCWTLFKRIAFPETEESADSSALTEVSSEAAAMKKIKAYLDRQKLKQEIFSVIEIEEEDEAKEKEMEMKCYLGRQMLNLCMGIPLAIKALAGLLSSKETVAEWLIVHNNLASHSKEHMNHGGGVERLFAVLELSYADLPYYLKSCFMYLSNFPEGYQIKAQRLYHLWEAEGLVTTSADNVDETEGMRLDDIAESYLNHLVERRLVQVSERWVNGRIRSCRLHQIMQDMCVMKSKEVNFVTIKKHGSVENSSSKVVSSSHVNRKLRRCALHLEKTNCDDDMPFVPNPNIAPSMRSLLVFPNRQGAGPKGLLSSKMSEFFSLLRVLELRRTGIPVDPKTAIEFIHLRYLSFKGATFFFSLPSPIWECKYLETLDLRWDTWDELSVSNKFQKLGRLRHLYLPNNMKLKGHSRWLILTDKQLRQMETLKNFNLRVCKGEDLGKMTSMKVFTFASFTSLLSSEAVELLLKSPMVATKRLAKPMTLTIEADVINFEEALSSLRAIHDHVCITVLHIVGRIDVAANLEICHQLHLRRLQLKGSKIGQEGISVLEKLPQLKLLILWEASTACAKVVFSNGGFPQLEVLYFIFLSELEEWEIGEGALPNLKSLYIAECGKLKMIPDGLPNSVYVTCDDPCISGVEKYNISPFAAQADEDESPCPSPTSNHCLLLNNCFSRLHH